MQNLNFWNPSNECKNLFYGKTKYKFKSNTLNVSEELKLLIMLVVVVKILI